MDSPTGLNRADTTASRRKAHSAELVSQFESVGSDTGSDLVHCITNGLSDTWSEVRFDTGKLLLKHSSSLTETLFVSLLNVILNKMQEASTWQALHGCLVGLNSLFSSLSASPNSTIGKKAIIKAHMNQIDNMCTSCLGHERAPIRDEVKKCYLHICDLYRDVTGKGGEEEGNSVWPILHSLIQSTPNSSNNSFALDITLQIVTHLLDSLDSLSILMDGATAGKQDDDKVSVIPYQYECLLSTIWKNFEHSDSTVRQSASQAMLSLLRRCAKTTESPSSAFGIADSITNEVFSTLSEILKRDSHTDWAALETALLVSEDVIWTSLTLSMTVQQRERENEIFDMFCNSLQGALSRSLLHNAFEIRRMGTQLLPLYVRYVCIRNPIAVADAIQSVNVEAENASLVVILLGLIWCMEFAKTLQHFVEVYIIEQMSNDPNNEDNNAFQPWILDMPGRLAETEKRTEFHTLLRRSIADENGDTLLSKIQCIVPVLCQQVYTLHHQWIAGIRSLENQNIVSADVAEALALSYTVLYSCRNMHLCNDPIAYITEQETLVEKQAFLAVDAWMQMPSLLITKVMKGSFEMEGMLLPSLTDPACAPEVLSILLPLEGSSSADNKDHNSKMHTEDSTAIGRVSTTSSINRWLCEAICPVMPILVKQVNVSIPPKYWTALLISWAFHVIKDPLWLDRKPLVRKHIFDALYVLTQTYTLNSGVEARDESDEMNTISKYLLSAMTLSFQSMCLNHRPIAVEAYEMNCLVSSMHRIMKYSNNNGNALLESFKTVLTKAQDKVNNMLQLMGSVNSGLISPQKSPKSISSPNGNGSVFLFPPSVVEASVETRVNNNKDDLELLNKNDNNHKLKPSMVVDIPTEPLDEVQEDEFSDWDEDSDDELNTSASSVRSLHKDADEEVNNLLECLKEALQYVQSV